MTEINPVHISGINPQNSADQSEQVKKKNQNLLYFRAMIRIRTVSLRRKKWA